MKYKSVLTCMFLLIARFAESATLEYKQVDYLPAGYAYDPLTGKNLVLTGEIKTGDAKKLLAMLLDPKPLVLLSVIVDSPGGSVDEAIKIAKLVKSLYVTVSVKPNGNCASACFFIFLAGSGRGASPAELMGTDALLPNRGPLPLPGFVGLHRPFLTRIDSFNNKQSDAMRFVASYLEGELLPRRLIDLMMSKPSNDIYWLREDDLAEIGDYPPEQEEYLIQKCNYDRNYFSKAGAARNQGNRSTVKKLLDQKRKEMECTVYVTLEAHNATMRKLKRGWLPY